MIYLIVWSSVANAQSGVVNGYTVSDFAAYFIVLMVVGHFTQIWHMWEFEYYIRVGELSARLMEPVHPIHKHIAENMSYKLLMVPVVIPAVILLSLLFQPQYNLQWWTLLAFIPTLILRVRWHLRLVIWWRWRHSGRRA